MKTHNSHNLITWGGFAIVTFLIYMLSSSGDFSFILTLAAGIQSFGFGQVIFTLKKTKDVGGVSWNTFSSCGLALLGRLLSVLLYEGYLPVDASGDYVYRGFESLSFIFCVLTLLELKSSPVTMR